MQQPKPKTETWPVEKFKPDPKELTRHDDPDAVARLGHDMLANGQLQAVGATEDATMTRGQILAAKAVGIKTVEVKVYPAWIGDTQFRLIRGAENIHRKDLTGYQKWMLCADLMCGNPQWAMKDLAEGMHLDPSMVTRLLSPSKCTPAWQDALRDGKVGISDCYSASLLSPADQAGLLALKLGGASRDEIARVSRKRRNGTTPTVKLSRVRCPLSTGTVVTVQGAEMTLEEMIEAFRPALEAARRANKDAIDIKTAERVWRDRAKVAG